MSAEGRTSGRKEIEGSCEREDAIKNMTKQHLWERVHEPYTQGHISQRGRKKDKMGEVRSLAVARMENQGLLGPLFSLLGDWGSSRGKFRTLVF